MRRVATIAACVLMLLEGVALAHEGHHHGHMDDEQMQKLHHMMPMYSETLPKMTGAVEKGDASAVKNETGKILATIPDLKKSKPHKNLKKLSTFRKIADEFQKNVKETEEAAQKGDFGQAKEAVKKVEASCVKCHSDFR